MNYFYPIFLTACLLLAACSKEEHTGEEVDPLPPIEEMVAISFNSTIELETKAEGETAADASQTLAEGVLVDVYAYKQDAIAIPTKPALVKRRYKIGAKGVMDLAESQDGIMYLPAGNYSFYALSVNANTAPPELINNSETAQLSNNTDYIYSATNVTIDSKPGETQTVSLAFSRLSTRIEIEIVNGGNGDDKAVAAENPSLTFAATNPTGSKFILGDNKITGGSPVKEISDYTKIEKMEGTLTDGFTASYIMLPMAAGAKIPATITFPSITFGDLVQKDKVYTLEIQAPSTGSGSGSFESGNQYDFKVNISGNEVTFQKVTVSAWTGVTGDLPNDNITEDFD